MSEKRAFTKLKQALAGKGRRIERVENMVGVGWPDCNGCFHGNEFWIEVKEPTEPKRASTPLFGSNHKLLLGQRNWILNQLNAGGLAYVYIDTGKHRILMSGKHADFINEATLQWLLDNALWHGTVPFRDKQHWEGIADVIIQRKI